MGVAFTNNWELLINKLQSVLSTEFGQTLKVYSSIKDITEASQYLQIKPAGSDSLEYYQDSEIREFSLSLELHYKNQNIKNRGFAQIMLLTSRVEEVISNNPTLTLSDNSKAHNCRIESTEINKDDPDEYVVIMDFKCVHANSILTPTVTITAAEVVDGATSSDSAISLTFTLNRDSDNFVVGDIDVTNGVLSNFVTVSSTIYTASFTASAQGATTIRVLADKFTGINATGGNTASDIFNWNYVPQFIFTVEIPSDDKTFALPIVEVTGHTPNFNIDWGDSSNDDITAHDDSALDHTYSTAGTKTIRIERTVKGLKFNNSGDKTLIRTISNWGGLDITETNTFHGCTNLTVTASNSPAISTTNLHRTFSSCSNLTAVGGTWDTSSVENFTAMFIDAVVFNQDISSWNMSSATSLQSMFSNAYEFNQDLGAWDTSNVTTMYGMFWTAKKFNNGGQPLTQSGNNWDMSNVTNMQFMMRDCFEFNQDIGDWDTSSVTNMHGTFGDARIFNQDIGNWNVSSVEDMRGLFSNAYVFNQDISSWDVNQVTDFTNIFIGNTGLSTANYNKLLHHWEADDPLNSKSFHGGDATTDTSSGGVNGTTARQNLIDNHSWTITDGDS